MTMARELAVLRGLVITAIVVLASTSSMAAVCKDADSPLGSLVQVGNSNSTHTPLILVHGVNGTDKNTSVLALSTTNANSGYWAAFIDQYWNSSPGDLRAKYQLWVFNYCSNRKSVKEISTALGDEISKKLGVECVFINSGMFPPLDDQFRVAIEELKEGKPDVDHLAVLLETNGGLMETVERLGSCLNSSST